MLAKPVEVIDRALSELRQLREESQARPDQYWDHGRFPRWKERTLASLAPLVSSREIERFRALRLGGNWTHPYASDPVSDHANFLIGLREDVQMYSESLVPEPLGARRDRVTR